MSQYECIYRYHFSEIFGGAMHATATSWDDWLWPGFYLLVGSRRWESAQYSSGPVCFYRKNHGAKYRPSGKLYILWTFVFMLWWSQSFLPKPNCYVLSTLCSSRHLDILVWTEKAFQKEWPRPTTWHINAKKLCIFRGNDSLLSTTVWFSSQICLIGLYWFKCIAQSIFI